MTNTKVVYEYRDGGNNKISSQIILEGAITEATLQSVLTRARTDPDANTEFGGFIPGQIGLPDLQGKYDGDGRWNSDLDHPMHEILSIEPTDEASVDRPVDAETFGQMVATIAWDLTHVPDGLICDDEPELC